MLFARVRSVDTNGYCGRDHHPTLADNGTEVLVVSVTNELHSNDPDEEPLIDPSAAFISDSLRHTTHALLQVFTCLRKDGSVVELIDQELDPAGFSFSLDEAAAAAAGFLL